MAYIWSGIIIFSFFSALFNGRMDELSQGIMDGAGSALEVFMTIMTMMCLWGGVSKIAERSGITEKLSKLLYPLLKLLFPDLDKTSESLRCISMNMTANILGLGNAATPLGLQAMRALKEESGDGIYATKEMIMFVVINTASIQIIPTTVAIMRNNYGSQDPMGIIGQVWIASIASFIVGTLCVKFMNKKQRKLRR